MKLQTLLALCLTAAFVLAQGNAKKTSIPPAHPESAEHRYARLSLEKSKANIQLLDTVTRCMETKRVLPSGAGDDLNNCEVIQGETFEAIEARLCAAFLGSSDCSKQELELKGALLNADLTLLKGSYIAEAQLGDVDKCVGTYKTTIDKKQSDLTQRELGQIELCKEEKFYPPTTHDPTPLGTQ